jgi:Protein phosphatase 2C
MSVFQFFNWKNILSFLKLITKNSASEEVSFRDRLIPHKMELIYQGIFCITKAGNTSEECEDAFRCSPPDSPFPWYLAIADGATESSFSREWASQLVQSFIREPFNSAEEIADWLPPLQQNWSNWLSEQDLLWFAKLKAAEGTYATLLGLKIDRDLEEKQWKWNAIAVGDSCLFVVHNNELLSCFPLNKSDELNSTPGLIGTLHRYNHNLTKSVKFTMGSANSGTHFYLVTDALAGWIFKRLESNRKPWEVLNNIKELKEFSGWIEELRKAREIRNDDTTLIHLYVE